MLAINGRKDAFPFIVSWISSRDEAFEARGVIHVKRQAIARWKGDAAYGVGIAVIDLV